MEGNHPVHIPGYSLETEIGRGGMAVVYSAMQESVERRVALKVMSRVLLVDTTFSERFMREAKIAANLYHPHIVAVHDVGVYDEQHYIAMEYLSGGDLAVRCGDNIQLVSTVRVVREIASALHYAHSKGFVHRDVKPENILFREDGGAVLTDFGIARAVNSATQMTKTGAVVGTPQYMSPEQARGKDLDGRSDLYGLGIVFHEMLTGRVPFEGNDSVAVGIQHVTEPVPRLPDKLEYIQPVLERFLAKHPDDRYQSGGEALVDLKQLEQRLLSGEVPVVTTPSGGDRATRISNPPPGQALPPMTPLDEKRTSDSPTPAAPSPPRAAPRKAPLAATPRPDGTVRQEPSLGAIDDLSSFDRTVSQPQVAAPPRPPTEKRRSVWPVMLVLIAALGGVAFWQKDRVLSLLPNRDVDRWLAQAEQAGDFGRWYGETSDFANVLYERVLEADPGNQRALAGQELVALYLCDRAEEAITDGNAGQAELLLSRARDIAPLLPRIAEVVAKLETSGLAPAGQQPIQALLDQARGHLDGGRLVSPPDSNALAAFRSVLELDARQAEALNGIADIQQQLTERAQQALRDEDLTTADETLQQLLATEADAVVLADLNAQLAALRQQQDTRDRAEQVRRDRIAQLLAEGEDFLARDQLGTPPGENASNRFRAALTADPENSEAQEGLRRVAQRYLTLAEIALEDDRLEQAAEMIARIEELNPDQVGLDRARRRLAIYQEQNALNQQLSVGQTQEVESLLAQAQAALGQGQLMQPPGSSAFDSFKAVLRLNPDNVAAQAGLRQVSDTLLAQADASLVGGELEAAIAQLADADQTFPTNPDLRPLRVRLAAAVRDAARLAIEAGRLEDAETWLTRSSDLEPDHPDLDALQLQLNIARE